jgi:prevent-host-death family protein
MIKVSATRLRQNLFDYLNRAAEGETIIIERNHEEVARLISMKNVNWRDKMTIKPEILVSPEELIEPMEDIWEEYS